MSLKVNQFLIRLEKFVNRPWYIPFISILAAVDHFVLVIPTDGLVLSTALLRPKKWWWVGLLMTTGSALGALVIAGLVRYFGLPMIEDVMGSYLSVDGLSNAQKYMDSWGGLALIFFAVGPIPVQPGVIIAGASDMPLAQIAIYIWVGRAIKYFLFAWVASHTPNLLSKFKKATHELEDLESARKTN